MAATLWLACASTLFAAKIPKLLWPTDGGEVASGFGADWDYQGCDGRLQGHAGIDIAVPRGTPVYAAAAGVVLAVSGIPQGHGLQWIVLGHRDLAGKAYTTVYWHIIPEVTVGKTVRRGRRIASVEGFGDFEHVHFGVRNAAFGGPANSLSLPRSKGCVAPQFPESFVDPLLVLRVP